MDEGTNPPGKQLQRRREFLLILLFQMASIVCCLLSFVLNITTTEAQEFLPISMHASRSGNYGADGYLYSFQKANLDLIAAILHDRDPQAIDIAFRATAVSNLFQTPIPTVTPKFSEPVDSADSDPTSSSTASNTQISTRTPTSHPVLEPVLSPTSKPTHLPITRPTYPPPKPHPYTSIPAETPTRTPTRIPAALPTATPDPTHTPYNAITPTVSNTPTYTPTGGITSPGSQTPTPTATSTSTQTPTITITPTITSTIHPTHTWTPTKTPTFTPTLSDTPTPTLSGTPTISATASSTPTNTSTSTPTNTPTGTQTLTPTATYTQTGTSTPTNTPTPVTPACFIGMPPGVLPSDDAYLKANSPTSNFGSLPNIEVRPDRSGNWRGLIRFDLSSIPPGSTVTQATLYLFEKDEKIGQVTDIHRVTTGWNEATVTWSSPWNNPGGDFNSSTLYASFTPNQKNCMITIDLSDLVQEWVNGTPNYGIILLSTGPNHIIRYSSKEDGLVPQQPKLYVTYSAP